MDDLRQAVIDILEEQIRVNGYSNVGMVSAINKSIGQIMRLPAAEPSEEQVKEYCRRRNLAIVAREDFPLLAAEPRKGKWIKNDGRYGWHCSVCEEDDIYAFVQDCDTNDGNSD